MTQPAVSSPGGPDVVAASGSRSRKPIGMARPSLPLRLYLIAVFLMPLQLELEAFKALVDSRLPPGDLFLALSVLLAPTAVKFRRLPVASLPLGLIVTLAYGMIVALVYAGELSNHAFTVKFVGAGVLVVLCLVTITYARQGHAPRILRTWVGGMVFWGLVTWIDWKVANIVPFVQAKTESRFGGGQFDPNNAGAAYAFTAVIVWQYGHRLFRSRLVRAAFGLSCVFFLAQTLSRGSYVGLAAGVAVVLVASHVSANRVVRYLGVAAVVIAAGIGSGFVDDAVHDFERRPDNVGDRNFKLTDSVDQFVESGGLGIGLGTYRLEQGQEVVHNTAVWLLSEMSLVGLAFFLAMAVVPAHAILRLRSIDFRFAMALLGAHVVMIVTSVGIEALYQRQWWLLIGLLGQPLSSRPRPVV